MKKVILIITALVLVTSGVAAVSAYEAHVINVTAKVENALTVTTTAVDFGTVFPQEFIKHHRNVGLSGSAITELGKGDPGDLEYVTIQPYAEWKADAAKTGYFWTGSAWTTHVGYWDWLGWFLYVGFDPSQTPMAISGMTLVGPPLAAPLSAQPILTTANLTDGTVKSLAIGIDVPVFEGYYNDLTDVEVKQSGLSAPTWIVPDGSEDYSSITVAHPAYEPLGMEFGIDLKIQVIDIGRVPPGS